VKSIKPQHLVIGGIALAAVLVAVGGYMVAIRPQIAKTHALDAQIATAQIQYAALHGSDGTRRRSLHAAELFQLSRAMPNSDDQPGVMLELSRLAAASSVDLMAIAMQPRVALSDGSSALPVNVTVDGSWGHLASFLHQVRNQVRVKGTTVSVAGRLFVIDSIQINPSSAPPAIEAVLQMSAFDYGAPPSPTATAGASGQTTTTTTTTTTPATSGSQQAAGTTGSSS
jgi:Tfp pilus assembly protein PilO